MRQNLAPSQTIGSPPITQGGQGRGRGIASGPVGQGNQQEQRNDRPGGVARTYAIRGPEARESTEVVIDKFSFLDRVIYALIDPGSTHSYICSELVLEKKLNLEGLGENIEVTNPLGHSVVVNKVCMGCPIEIQGRVYSANLIDLLF